MAANKLYMIQNPSPILNNSTKDASENTKLYSGRGLYRTIVKYQTSLKRGIDSTGLDLGDMYSDEIRFNSMNFAVQGVIPAVCENLVFSESDYLTSEYTMKNISKLNDIIIQLKAQNTIINFPVLHIN
jgi:hypothetical protein